MKRVEAKIMELFQGFLNCMLNYFLDLGAILVLSISFPINYCRSWCNELGLFSHRKYIDERKMKIKAKENATVN